MTRVYVADMEAAERMGAVAQLESRGFDVRAGSSFAASEDEVKDGIGDAQAVCVALGRVTRAVMDAAPDLELIVKSGIGVDNIDIEAARERDLPVLRMGHVNSHGPAEWVIGAAIAHLRRFREVDAAMRASAWREVRGGLLRAAPSSDRPDAGDRRARLDRSPARAPRQRPWHGGDRL